MENDMMMDGDGWDDDDDGYGMDLDGIAGAARRPWKS
jgi:hypothetical protein